MVGESQWWGRKVARVVAMGRRNAVRSGGIMRAKYRQ